MKKKTAIITGITGQDGPYLAKLLLEKNYKVYGLIKNQKNVNFTNTDYLGVTNFIEYITGDMTDERALSDMVKKIKPEEVYNLGAQSFVGSSWDNPRITTEVNGLAVLYILNGIKQFSPKTRFYQASTSEMFGNSSLNGLQNEETSFHPRSPYAIAKLYAHWITMNFKESYGLYCVSGILFNHESPIRGKRFVTRKISDGVARIALGVAQEIRLGNIDSKRDWGFAGDYTDAMWRMLQQPEPENYIISTGKTHSIKDFLELAFARVGINDWSKYIKIDPQLKRPSDVVALYGSSKKAKEKLNWEPKVNFKKLVNMMVDADLERVKKEK